MKLNMKLKQGTLLQKGKYTIEKVLGQGSFGITYLATAKFSIDGDLGKMDVVAKVAIKEFFMSDINSRNEDGPTVEGSAGNVFTNYRRKFRKEAENLAKLSHSNIVRVFDVFDENGTSYYVMEYLDGQNLDDYIKSQGRLKEDVAIKIIKEVGSALSYMHSKKMLHLDMKPKNIMHRQDSGNVLIDFGLSKQYTENGEPESSTSIGLDTPGYAPLEQAQYSQDGTFPATLDVYALGATMFKMLTGRRPPEATMILNEGFPSVELSNIGISKETIAAIKKSMSPFKRDRYQNISEFVSSLKNFDSDKKQSSITDSSIKSLLSKRNKLTTTCLIMGIIWFCMCTFGFQAESHEAVWGFLAFSSSIFYLFFTIRLFCNFGTGKYLPIIFSISTIIICIYHGEQCSLALLYTVIPYILILSSFFLKKNNISGFKSLKSTSISLSIIKQVWRDRNVMVNSFTVIGSIVTIFLASCGINFIYEVYRDFRCDYWSFSFMYISWMIGQVLVTFGYKLGCWIIWLGSLIFIGCLLNDGTLTDRFMSIIIALIPVLTEQLILLIRKNNKSAISVMV